MTSTNWAAAIARAIMTGMAPRRHRRWLIIAIAMAAVSVFLILGSTLGTSANSPIAGTWIHGASLVTGVGGLALAAALLFVTRAPRG